MEKEREIYRTLYLGHFKDIQEENARLKKTLDEIKKTLDEMEEKIKDFYETLGHALEGEDIREFELDQITGWLEFKEPQHLEYSPKTRKNEKGSDIDTGGDDKRPKTG